VVIYQHFAQGTSQRAPFMCKSLNIRLGRE
jgi:hypothetical protein